MRINTVAFALALFMVAGLIWGNIALVSDYNKGKTEIIGITKVYEGRLFFQDISEYNAFKQELATRDDIEIQSISELSSNKPLIIFHITVQGTTPFPYGKLIDEVTHYRVNRGEFLLRLILIDCAGFLLIGLFTYFVAKKLNNL